MARELILIALVAACGRDKSADRAAPVGTPPLAGAAFYRVDAGPQTPCAAGAACEARLVLTALGAYHVNKDYPFKFVGDPALGFPLDGEGTFALDDARAGTLTVRFRPRSRGTAKLVGTFKLSVCSSEVCEIEAPRIELVIPVT